jgi:hypothetical protein
MGRLKQPEGDAIAPPRTYAGPVMIAASVALLALAGWTMLHSGAPSSLVRSDEGRELLFPLLSWLDPETTPQSSQVQYLRIGTGFPSGGVRVSPAFSEIDSVNFSPDGNWVVFRGHQYLDRRGYSQGWYYLVGAGGGRARFLMKPPEHSSEWNCYWSPSSDEICFVNLGNLNDTTLVSVPGGGQRKIGMNPPTWWAMQPGMPKWEWTSCPQKATTSMENGPEGRVYRCGDKCAWVSREPLSPAGGASKPFVFLLGGVWAPLMIVVGMRSVRRSRKDRAAWTALASGAAVWMAFAVGTISFLLRAVGDALSHMM